MRADTLDYLAAHRRERTAALAEQLSDTIENENPGYRLSRLVPRTDLLESCLDNIGRVLELLAIAVRDAGLGHDVISDPAYDAARDTGARRAEQGLPLDDVLRSFRMGGRLIWDDLIEQAPSGLDADEIREIGTRLWEVVDETSAQVAASYHAHERAVVRADEQLRAELWEGVLGGRAKEPGFANDAAQILDLPVSGDYLVATATLLDIEFAESTLSPHATAWVRRTSGIVGLVALRDESPSEALSGLARAAASGLIEPVAIGTSAVVHGLAGVDVGFRQATMALRAQDDRPGLAAFDATLPEALLLGSPDVATRLVDVWLGPLLALPAAESQALLDTLQAWVETGGSAILTAERVPCHRNTVLNRLRRVAKLTGHDVYETRPPIELQLALRALRIETASR
ncbi:MAG: helix-turn-helix domain-containing protein [Nocardioides sp.]